MAFGLAFYNDHGTLLLDDTVPVWGVKTQGVATTTTPSTQLGTSKFTVTYVGTSASAPIVAIRPSALSSIIGATVSGTTWTWTFNSDLAIGATCPWWVFDLPGVLPESHGIMLRDAGANPTYFIGQKPLRIRDVIQYEGSPVGGLTYDSGRLYAGGFITGCGQSNRIASGPGLTTLRVFSLGVDSPSPGGITVAHHQHSQGSPQSGFSAGIVQLWAGALLILDVTNF